MVVSSPKSCLLDERPTSLTGLSAYLKYCPCSVIIREVSFGQALDKPVLKRYGQKERCLNLAVLEEQTVPLVTSTILYDLPPATNDIAIPDSPNEAASITDISEL